MAAKQKKRCVKEHEEGDGKLKLRCIDPIEQPGTDRQSDEGRHKKTGKTMQSGFHLGAGKPQALHTAHHAHGGHHRNRFFYGHDLQPYPKAHEARAEPRQTVYKTAQSSAGGQIQQKLKRDVFHGVKPIRSDEFFFGPATQILDRALHALRFSRCAAVTSVQQNPVMRAQ